MRLSEINLVLATRDEVHDIGAFLGSIPPEIRLIVVDASRDDTTDLVVESGLAI